MGLIGRFLLLAALAAQAPDRAAIDQTCTELSALTGFPIRRPIEFQVLSREQVRKFLSGRIDEAVKPAELRAEELTLKKFGFVPESFDLKKATLALLTEQTAAFYDYRRKRLFLTDWTSASLRDAAVIHELSHALADQTYSLDRFARQVEYDSEQAAARQAVVEGQANWLMDEVLKRHPQPERRRESSVLYPVFDESPLYLREKLTFPYTYGLQFQQAVYARFGREGFQRVFEKPPVSTQQILHPEVYFADTRPEILTLPPLRGMRRVVDGVLGEWEHSILLQQFTTLQDARAVSPHWRGAAYQIWEHKKTGRISLVYRSVWDTEEAASDFFALYRIVLQKKLARAIFEEDTATHYAGRALDGTFSADRIGKTVSSREGFGEMP